MFELLKEIWNTSKRNKLRISLTGFAVAWGIFMIISLLGAGNGLINAMTQEYNTTIVNTITIYGGSTSIPYNGLEAYRRIDLNDLDVLTTEKNFSENIEDLSAILSEYSMNISYCENHILGQNISGVYPVNAKINKREILYGRFINDIDMQERRKVLVLSENQAKVLSPDIKSLIGKFVNVQELAFKVVGIYKSDESTDANDALSPYTTIKAIYKKSSDEAGEIEFATKGLTTKELNQEFESKYQTLINKNHDAAPEDDNTLWIWNCFMDNIQMSDGISILRTALWVLGLFTLLSGIVGVSNIMLITVKERTHEFGIRKAIGAKPLSILKLIITESVIITTIFGYIGMIFGVLANEYMNATIGKEQIDAGMFKANIFVNPTVGMDICIETTLVMILAGTIAGLIPALKASRIRPIEALRAEK